MWGKTKKNSSDGLIVFVYIDNYLESASITGDYLIGTTLSQSIIVQAIIEIIN